MQEIIKKIGASIRNNCTLLCVILLFLGVIVPYIATFAKNGWAYDVGDWASLGSYLGGATTIISVWLIYITYNEQRKANHRKHFENVLYRKVDIIKKMQKKYRVEINALSDDLLRPFMSPHEIIYTQDAPIDIYEQALRLCYYYCTGNNGHTEDIEEMVSYINHTLSFIQKDALIDDKETYALEIDTVLSDEAKTILFYYAITYSNNSLFRLCKQSKLFNWRKPLDELFLWVVNLICKGNRKISRPLFDNYSWAIDNGNNNLMKFDNYLEMVEYLKNK